MADVYNQAMQYFIGVDGGGTKTDVVCATPAGEVVGRASTGPTNLTDTTVGAASFNLLEGLRQVTQTLPEGGFESGSLEVAQLTMGLAGMDTPTEHERAKQVFAQVLAPHGIRDFELVNDSLIALENGSDSANAVVLLSGTGANCYGKNEKGQTAKASGLDFLLTDQGSGYYIGRQVLREAVKSFDGRRSKSILEQLVCDFFKISSIEFLKEKVYSPLLTKFEVASLSPLCFKALDQGDAVASIIVEHAVEELVLDAEAVVRRLELTELPFDFVVAGSVMELVQIQAPVVNQLQAKFRGLTLKKPEKDPVFGALKMAMKKKPV